MCFFKKKKKEAAKVEAAKAEPAKKEEVKKETPKKEEPKKAEPAKKEVKETPKKDQTRVYHVVKRADGKWAVKFAGGEKVIKLFDTQKEAKEYTQKMAENQDGVMLVHNSKGKNKGRIQ